ncbi:hypothetical protein ATCC90586_004831 [Pythium insidiosum]|nr:hypothetical protein ATCC90586_004831 [Pythium insidiosum]
MAAERPEQADDMLTELSTVAARRGLRHQLLTIQHLSRLKRWSVALQLAEMDDAELAFSPPSEITGDVESALARVLQALSRERRCFDVVYAAGQQVPDVHGVVFDVSDVAVNASEVLAFSSTAPSRVTVRVVVYAIASEPSAFHVRCSGAMSEGRHAKELCHVLEHDDSFSIDKLISVLWHRT